MASDAGGSTSFPFSTSFPPVDLNHPAIQIIRLHPHKLISSESAQNWLAQFELNISSRSDDKFQDIFVGDNRHFHIFDNFNIALSFGRRVAQRLGFAVRIKTSSHNSTNGTTFKYICCSREGVATSSEHSLRQRRSVRCGCPWVCKLVGLHVKTALPVAHMAVLRQEFGAQADHWDTLWYWDFANKIMKHNHELDMDFGGGKSSRGSNDSGTVISRTPKTKPAGRISPWLSPYLGNSLPLSSPVRIDQSPLITASAVPTYTSASYPAATTKMMLPLPTNPPAAVVHIMPPRSPIDNRPMVITIAPIREEPPLFACPSTIQRLQLTTVEPSIGFVARSIGARLGVEWHLVYQRRPHKLTAPPE